MGYRQKCIFTGDKLIIILHVLKIEKKITYHYSPLPSLLVSLPLGRKYGEYLCRLRGWGKMGRCRAAAAAEKLLCCVMWLAMAWTLRPCRAVHWDQSWGGIGGGRGGEPPAPPALIDDRPA